MRVHLLSCPNTQPTDQYPLDGFCLRVQLFASVLQRLGIEVILYGVERTTAPCSQFVSVLTEAEQKAFIGETPYQYVPFDINTPLYLTFNTKVAGHIRSIKKPDDVIATIAGSAQMFVSEHHPELRMLEFSIGYRGVAAPYRIFQSHAWRHVVHGFTGVDGGRIYDAVIPPWFKAEEFAFTPEPDPYVLYCGRLVHSKGIVTACEAAEAAGIPLIAIGHGDASLVKYGEFRGAVSMAERNELLSRATAVLMPTQYIEPFGNVAAEAQLCGTPVIGPDFGAFVESIDDGITGFRCHTVGEYAEAIRLAPELDRAAIRRRAHRLYSEDAAVTAYGDYFRLLDLSRAEGWDSRAPGLTVAKSHMKGRYGSLSLYAGADTATQDATRAVGRTDLGVPAEAVA